MTKKQFSIFYGKVYIDRDYGEKEEIEKYTQWLKTLEGKLTTEGKKKNAEPEFYKNNEEALVDLLDIKPCDLKSEETSLSDAIKFCKDVFDVLRKIRFFSLTPELYKEIDEVLKGMGAANAYNVAEKFKVPIGVYYDRACKQTGNIWAPVIVFTAFLDNEKGPAAYWCARMREDGVFEKWINAQKVYEKKLGEE